MFGCFSAILYVFNMSEQKLGSCEPEMFVSILLLQAALHEVVCLFYTTIMRLFL